MWISEKLCSSCKVIDNSFITQFGMRRILFIECPANCQHIYSENQAVLHSCIQVCQKKDLLVAGPRSAGWVLPSHSEAYTDFRAELKTKDLIILEQ